VTTTPIGLPNSRVVSHVVGWDGAMRDPLKVGKPVDSATSSP
jgi:hypothetical protein